MLFTGQYRVFTYSFCVSFLLGAALIIGLYSRGSKDPQSLNSFSSAGTLAVFSSSLSSNPLYGPLQIPVGGVTYANAHLSPQKDDAYIDIRSPVSTNYSRTTPVLDSVNIFTQETVDIVGIAAPNIEKIEVHYVPAFGLPQTYELQKYKPGSMKWQYSAGVHLGNLGPGINTYSIRGYFKDPTGWYYVERVLHLQSGLDTATRVPSEEGLLTIQWLPEPEEWQPTVFFGKYGVLEVMKQYLTVVGNGLGDTGFRELLGIYRIGTIESGLYAGDNVYLYVQDNCFPERNFCGFERSISYFIERSDGALVQLKTPSSFTPLFVRLYDEHATLDLGAPEFLHISGSNNPLLFTGYGTMRTEFIGEIAFSLPDGREVIFADSQCFALQGNDGLERMYNFNFSIPDPDPSIAAFNTGDQPFAIDWLDGKRNTGHYKVILAGCMKQNICADVVHVFANVLPDIGSLTLIGRTDSGDEVYEILPEGRELRNPIVYLERIVPDSSWKHLKFPAQPADFYRQHPIIFIKDPFGRYLRFVLRTYWPCH